MHLLRLALLAAALAAAMPAAAEKRVALVVGNAAYKEQPLRNPVNDARAVAGVLREAGFEVILRENASKQALERAIADFGEKLGPDAVGLFYYAGHGIQTRGQNYLVPVDAQIASEMRVRIEAVDADLAIEQMAAAGTRVSLVVLDACRNNPFERRFRSAGEGGLAQIRAPSGTLIAYATAPGKVAVDGEGANSVYTGALVQALRQPGLAVEDVFKQVRVQVSRTTAGQQVPWESSSLTGEFVFRAGAAAPLAAPAPRPDDDPLAVEQAFWEAARDFASEATNQAYLERYPEGRYADQAKAKLAALAPRRALHDGTYRATLSCPGGMWPAQTPAYDREVMLYVRDEDVAGFDDEASRYEYRGRIDGDGTFSVTVVSLGGVPITIRLFGRADPDGVRAEGKQQAGGSRICRMVATRMGD